MEAIKDTIQQVIARMQTRQQEKEGNDPGEHLKKLLTKKELEHIRVTALKNGILYVNVDSSVWLYRLSIRTDAFLETLNKLPQKIKSIRFRVGDIT